jgi:hypothetical protein
MSCNYKTNIKDIQSKYTFKIFCAGDTSQIEQEIGDLSQLTTTAKDNLVNAINEVDGDLSAKEDKSNKVTTITSSSTDTQYPSAKLLYNQLALKEDVANKTTTLSSSSTDTQYPSAKCVYDSQQEQDTQINNTKEELQETQNELDYYKTIYNVLPKVEGNGESITLSNTGESILKMVLYGNTSQESTNGYNIFDLIEANLNASWDGGDANKITIVNDRTIQTTANYNNWRAKGIDIPLAKSSQTYTLSLNVVSSTSTDNQVAVQIWTKKGSDSGVEVFTEYWGLGEHTKTFTTGDIDHMALSISSKSAGTSVVKDIQIEEGSAAHDWEQYSGGIPAPNPSYPYPIHEVSGDNEIVVCGKNFVNENSLASGGSWIYTNKTFSNNNTDTRANFQLVMEYYNSNNERLGITSVANMTGTGRKSSTFNCSYGNVSFVTFKHNGSSRDLLYYLPLCNIEPNQDYTISFDLLSNDPTTIGGIQITNIQIEKGTTATDYEPYKGDTYELSLGDIKLRGIGTYEDYFVRGTGINKCSSVTKPANANLKFNFSKDIQQTITISFTTNEALSNNSLYLEVDGTSLGNVGGITGSANTRVSKTIELSDENYQAIKNGTNIDLLLYKNGANFNIPTDGMIENGSSVSVYEPYNAKDMWCKYNAIGKVVLDGDETWTSGSISDNNIVFSTTIIDGLFNVNENYRSLCNDFTYNANIWNTDNLVGFALLNVSYSLRMRLEKTRLSDTTTQANAINSFKTWLGNNYTQVDYVLSQPYLSLIESETLINQLDAIEKALGKDGTTNISQVNNDAPFKIYASALMKISGE